MEKFFRLAACMILLLFLCSCSEKTFSFSETREALQSKEATETVSDGVKETLGENNTLTTEENPSQGGTASPESPSNPETSPETPSNPETSPQTPPTTTAPIVPAICTHKNTIVKNQSASGCTTPGYTGDTYCKDCNMKLFPGSQLPALGHRNTEIRNNVEATTSAPGYTGDIYCKDCGTKILDGNVIPKIETPYDGKTQYILPDGTSVFVDSSISDVTGHYMAEKTKTIEHLYLEVEKEIVRLCNIEREKEGLQPLAWFEDAYYFTNIRATESHQLFSHTRPNGKPWYSVYFDAGVIMTGYFGENLFEAKRVAVEAFAASAVNAWMNSPGHRANIMNGDFNRIAIAIVEDGDALTAVQNFFS